MQLRDNQDLYIGYKTHLNIFNVKNTPMFNYLLKWGNKET